MGDRAPGPGGRNAHRCTPQTDHMARQLALGANPEGGMQCERLTGSQLKEVNSTRGLGGTDDNRAAAVRCCRACFPCASPASSSSWAGLRFRLYGI